MALNVDPLGELSRIDALRRTKLQSMFKLRIVNVDGEYSAGLTCFGSLTEVEKR